jgi:hypothetical protein
MNRYELRKKGVNVLLLDTDKTTALIRSRYSNASTDLTADQMVVVNGDKGLAVVCTEGVGYFADEHGKFPVNYSLEELLPLISTTTIDLADHVRVFGDRLENNLAIWQDYAKGFDQTAIQTA